MYTSVFVSIIRFMKAINLKEKVYVHLSRGLGGGLLKAGHRISETRLAKELGVSRTPVREAIRRLESEGVVRQIPRYGTFVRKLSLSEFRDIWDLRKLLEDYTVSRAAARRTEEDVKKLESIVVNMRETAHNARKMSIKEYYDSNSMTFLDIEFHRFVAVIAGNACIIDLREKNLMLTNLVTRVPVAERAVNHMQIVASCFRSHCRIFRAIRDQNVEAARYLIDNHLSGAFEGHMSSIAPDLPSDERLIGYDGYSLESLERYRDDL